MIIDQHTAFHAYDAKSQEVINGAVISERKTYLSADGKQKQEVKKRYVKATGKSLPNTASLPGPQFNVMTSIEQFPFFSVLK